MSRKPVSEWRNIPAAESMDEGEGKGDSVKCKLHPGGGTSSHASVANKENRIFPFVATPSGNLKIVPTQVVFESKKVSVLVADPKRTKVNVRSEIENPPDFEEIEKFSQNEQINKYFPNNNLLDNREQMYNRNDDNHGAAQNYSLHALGFNSSASVDWSQVALSNKTCLVDHLLTRILNFIKTDCSVHIANETFNCHQLVLQSYSKYFDSLTDLTSIDLSVNNVTPSAFTVVYDWMLYMNVDSYQVLERMNVLDILQASQFLQIQELEEQCWAFLKSDKVFFEDTAFHMFVKATRCGNNVVSQIMAPRIMRFFLTLVSSTDFLNLSVKELCVILSSDNIAVHGEIEVFMSAVRWLTHDYTRRKVYLLDVMKCIRFGLIAPWQLVDIRRNPENLEFLEITSYSEVQQLIEDGLAFVIIKYWYGNNVEEYNHWINVLGLQVPVPRQWIGEEKKYITYQSFLEDLLHYHQPTALINAPLRSHTDIHSEYSVVTDNSSISMPPPFTMVELLAQTKQKDNEENQPFKRAEQVQH